MSKVIRKHKVDPERWYSIKDVTDLGLFPWCKDFKTIRSWIQRDKKGKNILRVVVTGKGQQRRYKILGRHLLEFVTTVENGHYL